MTPADTTLKSAASTVMSADTTAMSAVLRERRDLRHAFGQFATGVTVATTCGKDGRPIGLTVSSFTSVSLEPALVLWSIARSAGSFAAFRAAGYFALSVLSAQQRSLATRFAMPGADRFADVAWWRGRHGLPLLCGAVAHFACRVASRVDAGDHVVLIGEVEAYRYASGAPLVFHAGGYATTDTHAAVPA